MYHTLSEVLISKRTQRLAHTITVETTLKHKQIMSPFIILSSSFFIDFSFTMNVFVSVCTSMHTTEHI